MTTFAKKYLVNSGGLEIGPIEGDLLVEKVQAGEIKATDFVLDSQSGDWTMICQVPELMGRLGVQKPQRKVTPLASAENNIPNHRKNNLPVDSASHSTGGQWFLLKGNKNYGPFKHLDLVKMLQEKSVFEYDFVWKEGMDSWCRLAEREEFAKQRIRSLLESGDEEAEKIFIKRKAQRVSYQCPVLAHNNDRVWRGVTVELSEQGASLEIHNSLLIPGQNVYIHFMAGPASQAFNVLSEVVSKRFVKGLKNKNSPIIYGVKFINIDRQEKEEIKAIKSVA